MDVNITQANIDWETDLGEHHENQVNDNIMPKSLPKENGLSESPNTTQTNINGVFNEPQTRVQPFVDRILFGKQPFLENAGRKRKRDSYSLNLDTRNLQEIKYGCVELPQSPSSPTWSSVVTVLKYQDGEFVKIHNPSSSYNSPMSLQDMRKTIIASLESFISQPNIDFQPCLEPVLEPVTPVNIQTSTETSPEVKKSVEFPEPLNNEIEVPKHIKCNPPTQAPVKKVKSPDKESIKFAKRQKELMTMKKEMKKKFKMENSEVDEASKLSIWGRTVGVSCTMCGTHVQKSYGCFRRNNAPKKLLYLFTPGMNRIKICRRCLPYKKQGSDGTPENTGVKAGEKSPENDAQKSNTKHTVNKTLVNEKPVSTSTCDAIQRKLTSCTAANENVEPKSTILQSKIVLGESAKGDAIEYIKKLAENLKANYNKVDLPDDQTKTPLSQQHATLLTPVTPSSNQIQPCSISSTANPEKPGTSLIATQWTPLVINQGSSSAATPTTTLGNIRLSVRQEKTGSSLIHTPRWTPLVVKQALPSNITSPFTLASPAAASTSKAVPSFRVSTNQGVQAIPAIVVSSKNVQPGSSSVLLQIQRVKLIKEKTGDSKEVRTKIKVDDEPAVGKNKRVRMVRTSSASSSSSSATVYRPVTCVSCKSNVVKSYRCVNHSLSPPKLQHLFSNEREVLRICRKCLFKDSGLQQKTFGKTKVETDEKQLNKSTGGDSQEFPGTSKDQEDLRYTSKDNNLDGTLGDKSTMEGLEDTGTLRGTDGTVNIESAIDINNGDNHSIALDCTLGDNWENDGLQGGLSLSDEKVETVEPIESSQEENVESSPRQSVGGLEASYRDADSITDSEFMLGVGDIIGSAVSFGTSVDSDGNLGAEAVDFRGIGEVPPADEDDSGVNKDNKELLERYEEQDAILKDILDAEESEELVVTSRSFQELNVEFHEKKSELPLVNKSGIEEGDTVKGATISALESQGNGEFSTVETVSINTKGNEVDLIEELSKEFPWEEVGADLCTCVDRNDENSSEKEESGEKGLGKEGNEEKGIGKENNEGKSTEKQESEVSVIGKENEGNSIEKDESEETELGKEKNGGKIIEIEESHQEKGIVKEGNEENSTEKEENEENGIGNDESEEVGIGKERNEENSIENEEMGIGKEESRELGIGKERNEESSIENEEKILGKEESEEKVIGKEENEENIIERQESHEEKGIGKEESREMGIGKERNEESNIENEEKGLGKDESREMGIGKEESEENSIENEEKMLGKEESEEKVIGKEENKEKIIERQESHEEKGIGKEKNSIEMEESEEKGKEENEEDSIEKEESEGKVEKYSESGFPEGIYERDLEIDHDVESEMILNEEEAGISNKKKASGLIGNVKDDIGKRAKATKSAATENTAVKDNDKRLRQRRTVASPQKSPAMNEKKTEAKWHHKTRGALLKKQKETEKETESVSETTQSLKRKKEKRHGRGKKTKFEDPEWKVSVDETKATKEELTNDAVKGSPSKRMKTRKD